MLRYEIYFHPSWWHREAGTDVSKNFWYDPETRFQADMSMRRVLFEQFGMSARRATAPVTAPWRWLLREPMRNSCRNMTISWRMLSRTSVFTTAERPWSMWHRICQGPESEIRDPL